jgi:hypothetical protein
LCSGFGGRPRRAQLGEVARHAFGVGRHAGEEAKRLDGLEPRNSAAGADE